MDINILISILESKMFGMVSCMFYVQYMYFYFKPLTRKTPPTVTNDTYYWYALFTYAMQKVQIHRNHITFLNTYKNKTSLGCHYSSRRQFLHFYFQWFKLRKKVIYRIKWDFVMNPQNSQYFHGYQYFGINIRIKDV